MQLYRFSPIKSEAMFQEALVYVTEQLEALSQTVLGEKLPVSYLKIFPHYLEEYEYLHKLVLQRGPQVDISSPNNLYVSVNETIQGNCIRFLGLRIVDPYRLQVGCGDYEVANYESYKKKFTDSPFVRDLGDKGMLEIWNPDFDVLGYVIPKE